MLTFLFWNIQKKPLAPRVARIVAAHGVDVVVLAECVAPREEVAALLSGTPQGDFRIVPGSGARLHLYSHLPIHEWKRIAEDPYEAWLGFRVWFPMRLATTLFIAHMPSKLQTDEDDRLLAATELAVDIRNVERAEGHERTLVVGDLNVNPFERPVVSAKAFHAVMTKDVARRRTRTIKGREYSFFYNPMWAVFGDRTPGPPGTYYRSAGHAVNYFWNTYDQVLLRPALMDSLELVEVLDADGESRLLNRRGLPNKVAGSDHLPLVFRMNL